MTMPVLPEHPCPLVNDDHEALSYVQTAGGSQHSAGLCEYVQKLLVMESVFLCSAWLDS